MSTTITDLRNLPSHLDVAELMRHVLADKRQGEEIDLALRRVLQQKHPEAAEALFNLLAEMLGTQQRMLAITREQAATQLAQAKSEMRLSPEGKPEITSFRIQAEGLDHLSPQQREQVLRELERAVRTGAPLPKQVVMMPQEETQRAFWPVLAIFAIIASLAALYFLGLVLGRG